MTRGDKAADGVFTPGYANFGRVFGDEFVDLVDVISAFIQCFVDGLFHRGFVLTTLHDDKFDIAQNKTINGFENEHIDLVREFSSKFSYEAGRLIGDTVNNFYKGLWESSELPDFAKAIIKAFKKSS